MFTVTVTEQGLDDLLGKIPNGPARHQTLGRVLDKGRVVVLKNIMRRWSVRTGFARRSGTTNYDQGMLQAHVVFTAGYAAFPDQGVRPHFIAPRAAMVLRFVDPNFAIASGQISGFTGYQRRTGSAVSGAEALYVYSYGVRHPGQRAQHFMANGLLDSLVEFKAVMEAEAGTMLKGPKG